MAEVSGYNPDMLIWVDKTGSDRCNSIRSFGYALRGTRPVCHLSMGGRRVCNSGKGIKDVFTTTDRVNGEVFEHFIYECILPIILPFDGNNP